MLLWNAFLDTARLENDYIAFKNCINDFDIDHILRLL